MCGKSDFEGSFSVYPRLRRSTVDCCGCAGFAIGSCVVFTSDGRQVNSENSCLDFFPMEDCKLIKKIIGLPSVVDWLFVEQSREEFFKTGFTRFTGLCLPAHAGTFLDLL
jgi:hypothetical protein